MVLKIGGHSVLHLSAGPFGTAVPVSRTVARRESSKEKKAEGRVGQGAAGANWLMPVITGLVCRE